jgi:UDP-N-acetyl-D-mannosaminuronic acid dehydrogenase
MKSVCVVGLGYIGLPTAVLAAQSGYQVFGFDIDQKKIDKINAGNAPFVEPEISERMTKVLNKNFFVSTDIQQADCFLIAVPTPFRQESENKKADLSYVFDAARNIAKVLHPGNLVILESTVPVGTTYEMGKLLEQETGLKLGLDIFVAHCPERVLPGRIFEELVKNDRIIGGICESSAHIAKTFYSKFVKAELYLTDDKTAEMVKLVENSSRDVQIAFANQVAAMCKTAGINPFEVIECANKHPRVNILSPGCGVGGHCIAVDPWFLVESFPYDTELLKTARDVNDNKPLQVVADVLKKVYEMKSFRPKVLILGLTFKPDVDDMRESPALKIALELNKYQENLQILVCDPNISADKLKQLGFNSSAIIEGIAWSDIILILVNHKEFYLLNDLNLDKKKVFDACGLLYKSKMKKNSENFNLNFKVFKKQSGPSVKNL